MINETVFGEYKISSDKTLLQTGVIHSFLHAESHWARGICMELMERSIANSICFGVYHLDNQVGFARVISDKATFAYLADVFIIDSYRGKGSSKKLLAFILEHPELQHLRSWLRTTSKAQGLYEKFGWKKLNDELQNNYIRKQVASSYTQQQWPAMH